MFSILIQLKLKIFTKIFEVNKEIFKKWNQVGWVETNHRLEIEGEAWAEKDLINKFLKWLETSPKLQRDTLIKSCNSCIEKEMPKKYKNLKKDYPPRHPFNNKTFKVYEDKIQDRVGLTCIVHNVAQ